MAPPPGADPTLTRRSRPVQATYSRPSQLVTAEASDDLSPSRILTVIEATSQRRTPDGYEPSPDHAPRPGGRRRRGRAGAGAGHAPGHVPGVPRPGRPQLGGERGDRPGRVAAVTVEPLADQHLDPAPDRLEGGGGEGRARGRQRGDGSDPPGCRGRRLTTTAPTPPTPAHTTHATTPRTGTTNPPSRPRSPRVSPDCVPAALRQGRESGPARPSHRTRSRKKRRMARSRS